MSARHFTPAQQALKERLIVSFTAHVDDLIRDMPYWAPEVQTPRIRGRLVALGRSLEQIIHHHTHGGTIS